MSKTKDGENAVGGGLLVLGMASLVVSAWIGFGAVLGLAVLGVSLILLYLLVAIGA